ncbi:AIPR family protein [Mucilaginibacter sp.]|uniref:AIPR family protein n=1 Tax=Mucilaginibacter sp. TaxID=1882438 RepID=UPI003265C998
MTNLASFSILNEKVNKIVQDEKIEPKGMAFIRLCLQIILKLNGDEIEEAITDGPMDGEIDAIYIADMTIHILTFKYTDNFEFTKKNYPESEIDQFVLTVESIIAGNLLKSTVNDAVWEKYEEIKELISKGRIDFKIHIASNKEKPVPHAQLKLNNAIDKFKTVEPPIYYDQEDLVSKILENKVKLINGKLRFIDRQYLEKSNGNIKTLIGAVSANDLIDLIKDPENHNLINEDIFNENVRVYKPKHRVNKAIIESAKSESNYQFFYMNNGITILCQEADYRPNTPSPLVELTNLQIINGGQTSHSLFEVYKTSKDKLDMVEILIRICIARKNDPISDIISETSNSQIPVGNRDLHSNDLIQKKLEEEFLVLGYHYERKPNQHFDKPHSTVLNNELLGQLCIAYFLDMPSEAKNSKSRVFSDLYDKIFEENIINATKLLMLQKIYKPLIDLKKSIQAKKRSNTSFNEEDAFVSRATFHILNGVKIIYESDFKTNYEALARPKEKEIIRIAVLNDNLTSYIEKSIKLIGEVVKDEKSKQGDSYNHDKFFKEISTNGIIRNYIRDKVIL